MDALDQRHGTTAGHKAHQVDGESACLPCVRAKTRYEKRRAVYGDLMVPAVGTRRRIQALKALGHSGREIADELGVSYQAVHKYERGTSERIFVRTAERIARVYADMCMVIPNGYHRTRIRNAAAREGYAPPLAWDDIDNPDEAPTWGGRDCEMDPVVVMRLLEGRRVEANRDEREEAIRRWVEDGGSKTELCNLHGWEPGRYMVETRLRLVRGGAA